jgi:hypothetical protein
MNNLWAAGGPPWLYLGSRLLFDVVLFLGGGIAFIMPPLVKQWIGKDIKQQILLRLFGVIILVIIAQNLWALYKAPFGY